MTNTYLARTGAACFVMWGLLHIAGGLAIFATGFEAYGQSGAAIPPLAHAILQYFALLLIAIALASVYIGVRFNWKNSATGLAANTVLIATTEVGLIAFLILPGHVTWIEASPGFVLFAAALACSTLACRNAHPALEA